MPVLLSRSDAREVARACRALALQTREQGERFGVGSTREYLLANADRLEQLAAKFEAHAASSPPPQHTQTPRPKPSLARKTPRAGPPVTP